MQRNASCPAHVRPAWRPSTLGFVFCHTPRFNQNVTRCQPPRAGTCFAHAILACFSRCSQPLPALPAEPWGAQTDVRWTECRGDQYGRCVLCAIGGAAAAAAAIARWRRRGGGGPQAHTAPVAASTQPEMPELSAVAMKAPGIQARVAAQAARAPGGRWLGSRQAAARGRSLQARAGPAGRMWVAAAAAAATVLSPPLAHLCSLRPAQHCSPNVALDRNECSWRS